MFAPERKHGVSLYCKRIFIMENCKELMPEYMRFVKGVVDAPDLNLNVSREILQQDGLVRNIKNNLMKKIFSHLKKMDSEKYNTFWENFGQVIKEGVHSDAANKDNLLGLLRFKTTKSEGKWVSFEQYVDGMKADQKEIYYLTGDDVKALVNSPHVEALKKKEYEVILFTDPVDEWVVQSITEYKEHKLTSAEKGELDLGDVDEKDKEKFSSLFDAIKDQLKDTVKEVKPSTRLTDSVVCLSGDTQDMSAYMEKIMQASGQAMPDNKRVLEINMQHPVMNKMLSRFEKDKSDPSLNDYATLLYDIATVSEGGKLKNPAHFSKMVGDLMNDALES